MPQVDVPEDEMLDALSYAARTYAPEVGAAGVGYAKAVYQSSRLPLRILEAARYRTALINGCTICKSMRAARDINGYLESVGGDASQSVVARGGAAPDEAFYAAVEDWRDAPAFSTRERLAIEYAERMGEAPKGLAHDGDFWERMHASFSQEEIMDLTLCIGAWMALGRTVHVLGLDAVCFTDALATA
jgi:alkylhydroperoxidase family enzyme